MKKHRFIFVFIMIAALLSCVSFVEGSGRLVRVGRNYSSPESDAANSYCDDYLKAIKQFTGWEYVYVDGTWQENLERLQSGEIDILGFVHKTDERMLLYSYPHYPISTSYACIIASDRSTLNVEKLLSLSPIRVGVARGNAFNADFERYSAEHNLNVEYVEYDGFADISPAFDAGEIDIAVMPVDHLASNERIIVRIAAHDQYFVTSKNNHEVFSELDSAMTMVNVYYPYLNNDLTNKYFTTSSSGKPVFTLAEQQFINEHPSILVMFDAFWPPVEYYDEESREYRGISLDLFALLTEKCGINFVYKGSTSGDNLLAMQGGDKRNTLMTISYDYDWADKHHVFITQPFFSSKIVRLGKNPNSPNPTIAINKNAFFTFELRDFLNHKKTISFPKQFQRLDAVLNGEADYTFVTEAQAKYYLSIPKYSDFKMENMVGHEQKVCIGIEENSDPELMSILSKSLASVSHDEMNEIIMKNTVGAYRLTFSDRLYMYRTPMAVACVIFIALVILLYNRHRAMIAISAALAEKEEALRAAEKANEAKGNFMASMSHEIRTPMNAVIGYNAMARKELESSEGDDIEKQKTKVMDCLKKSDIASEHLMAVINDVLDMSAIDSGHIKLAHERFNFATLIQSIVAIFSSQAQMKGVSFEMKCADGIDEWLIGDEMRTKQILTNLISNAVKFTSSGGSISFVIDKETESEQILKIKFIVSDTGIGMTEEYLTHIFTPFEQEDSSISRRFGGTGLGLSITKGLTEMLGGSIDVKSKYGEGSTFTVMMPFDRTLDEPSKTDFNSSNDDDAIPDFHGARVMLAEDNDMNMEIAMALLGSANLSVDCARNGREAVDMFMSASPHTYRLILMDVQMPEMDGHEATRTIRSSEHLEAKTIPIIAMTADAFAENIAESKAAGMNDHISKPIDVKKLFETIKKYLV